MATKVHMEALSPTMEEGQVVKWLKSEGDAVTNGELLAEIETDKATMELVARGDGILRKIFVAAGGVAPVGAVIGVIAAENEDVSGIAGSSSGESAAPAPGAAVAASSGLETLEEGVVEEVVPATAARSAAGPEAGGEDGRIKASPLARRVASKSGVSLSGVPGSGPHGRIVKRDIEAAIAQGPATPAAQPAASAAQAPPPAPLMALSGPEFEDVALSQVRKTIARRLSESLGPVPHFFLNIHVDMSRMQEARQRINAMLEPYGQKVSLNDLVVRGTAAALTRHPECNAHWLGDKIRRFNRVHIGIAVAIEDGLITPVIRDAQSKGLAQIAMEVKDMAARARDKKLKPEEYTGSTFSISNLGMFGIYEFTAIINPPEAGILAIGGIEDWPVEDPIEGIRFVPRMKITMSCDHRVIDGATGARFLQTLKAMLEEPGAMLV